MIALFALKIVSVLSYHNKEEKGKIKFLLLKYNVNHYNLSNFSNKFSFFTFNFGVFIWVKVLWPFKFSIVKKWKIWISDISLLCRKDSASIIVLKHGHALQVLPSNLWNLRFENLVDSTFFRRKLNSPKHRRKF